MSDSAGARPESVAPVAVPPEKPALSLGPSPTPRESAPAAPPSDAHGGHGRAHSPKYMAKLAIAALGVVFGDIGTSPLYSMRECFHAEHGMPITRESVLGILSLIFWSLMLIVAVKYVFYVLRADNKGEGGILSLMALATSTLKGSRLRAFVIACGVFGAALLYGDGAITPAISVLSAVEGLQIAAPSLDRLVIPLTIAILVGLFVIQKRGTASVGAVFGPITLVWFFTIGGLGLYRLLAHPGVLAAVSPTFAAVFLAHHGKVGFTVLGAVFLVVTGGEALYADLGHFGRRPIQLAWFALVFPALLLNYFGQGSLLLERPEDVENPFFRMAPEWALYPLVALSTAATVIASQALITGVYSLTQQATMLGFMPRTDVRHTSADERGQIYVPTMNWLLMLATVSLVLGFKTSSELAAAYGIAVTLTMVMTTVLAAIYASRGWGWKREWVAALTILFLVPETIFLIANLAKIAHGGWFPLAVGVVLFMVMTTWRRGREILARRFQEDLLPLTDFFDLLRVEIPARVPGTAVFMTSIKHGTPPALLRNFMHNRVVHQHIVLVTITTAESARVAESERFEVEHLEEGFSRITGRYGFMEQPDAPALLERAGLVSSVEHTTFFLGRENLISSSHPGMARWRIRLFAALTRNAQPANKFFNIPPDRVMEIGAQIEL
ncbi:MAG TPA: potassium transporter Kup [Polyangiaceae bacterium]|jgi:KUP system potassium uptake protein|nr:potassium transporter Kup [Polyangiaceae bacterium]